MYSLIYVLKQLYAIREKHLNLVQFNQLPLKNPLKCSDFNHIMAFCKKLTIVSVHSDMPKYHKDHAPSSDHENLDSQLPFEFRLFENMQRLYLDRVPLDNVCHLGGARQTVLILVVFNSNIRHFSDILLCDKGNYNLPRSAAAVWTLLRRTNSDFSSEWKWWALQEANLSWNNLHEMDDGVKLMPNIKSLTLMGNRIERIVGLDDDLAPHLQYLCLADNRIDISDKEAQLEGGLSWMRNVTRLNVSNNRISLLKPFAQLVQLEHLNLKANLVTDRVEITHIARLPRIRVLYLADNPVSTHGEFRMAVFLYFKDRVSSIYLDDIPLDNNKYL